MSYNSQNILDFHLRNFPISIGLGYGIVHNLDRCIIACKKWQISEIPIGISYFRPVNEVGILDDGAIETGYRAMFKGGL